MALSLITLANYFIGCCYVLAAMQLRPVHHLIKHAAVVAREDIVPGEALLGGGRDNGALKPQRASEGFPSDTIYATFVDWRRRVWERRRPEH